MINQSTNLLQPRALKLPRDVLRRKTARAGQYLAGPPDLNRYFPVLVPYTQYFARVFVVPTYRFRRPEHRCWRCRHLLRILE